MPSHVLTVYRPLDPNKKLIAKKVRQGSNELEIHELLNTIQPKSDHVISLLDSFHAPSRQWAIDHNLPSTVLKDVKLALEKLHNAGFVFGNVRRPNIMVYKSREKDEEEWRGLLVDFDWAGPVRKTKYLAAILKNSGEINWVDGMSPRAEIKKEHDLDMLKKKKLNSVEN